MHQYPHARGQAQQIADGGDLAGARTLLEGVVEAGRPGLTSGDPELLETMRQLAGLHARLGDPTAARRLLEEAYAAGRGGPGEPLMVLLAYDLAVVADELANRLVARKNFGLVARYGPAALGEGHPAVAHARDYGAEGTAGLPEPPTAPLQVVTPPAVTPPAVTPPVAGPAIAPMHGTPVPMPSAAVPAPVSGSPVSASPAPVSGTAFPVPGTPASGTPAFGQPISGTPTSVTSAFGQPVPGTPASGTPPFGQPISGTPASGTPASGTPASGTPPFGQPVSGTPGFGRADSVSGAPVSSSPLAAATGSPAPFGASTSFGESAGSSPGGTARRERSLAPWLIAAAAAAVISVVALVAVLVRPDGEPATIAAGNPVTPTAASGAPGAGALATLSPSSSPSPAPSSARPSRSAPASAPAKPAATTGAPRPAAGTAITAPRNGAEVGRALTVTFATSAADASATGTRLALTVCVSEWCFLEGPLTIENGRVRDYPVRLGGTEGEGTGQKWTIRVDRLTDADYDYLEAHKRAATENGTWGNGVSTPTDRLNRTPVSAVVVTKTS